MTNISAVLETVSSSCLELKNALHGVKDIQLRKESLERHIEKLMSLDSSVPDFQTGLEWFNSGEPLSLQNQLKKKIVILDFFTYCCINCMHILPLLKEVEERFLVEDGVAVVGVHSAKFENEKDSSNIAAAIQRYNVSHPVVNDADGVLWSQLNLFCWPTLLILGPGGHPLFQLVGEGQEEYLHEFVEAAVEFFKCRGELSPHSLPPAPACNKSHTVGTEGQSGFTDGDFRTAQFHSPQGVAFMSSSILFVADTGNHAIRKVDLRSRSVVTVAGNGLQSSDLTGGRVGAEQSVSSPWDLCVIRIDNSSPPPYLCICPPAPPGYSCPDPPPPPPPPGPPFLPPPPPQPPSLHLPPPPPQPLASAPPPPAPIPSPSCPPPPTCPPFPLPQAYGPNTQEVLLIAMAGSHQIWGLFFQDTIWWKRELFQKGVCTALVGSGREENRNNLYPHSAAFAQPSGITYSESRKEVFVADSESSSIRCISVETGKVSPLVGASKIPNDLFCFGDVDGSGYDARLQHPLGVAWDKVNNCLYAADSYNHKIKKILPESKTCCSLIGSGLPGDGDGSFESQLNEPGGICMSENNSRIYIADTNNHSIKVVDLSHQTIRKLFLKTQQLEPSTIMNSNTSTSSIGVRCGGTVTLLITVSLPPGVKLTEGAPQRWLVKLPNTSWRAEALSGIFDPHCPLTIRVGAPQLPAATAASSDTLSVTLKLFLCTEGACRAASSSHSMCISFDEEASPNVTHKYTMFIK